MVTLTVLAIIIGIMAITCVIIALACGVGTCLVVGDLLVAIMVILLLVRRFLGKNE